MYNPEIVHLKDVTQRSYYDAVMGVPYSNKI